MATLNWTASETQKVEPFQISPSALQNTQLRLMGDDDFDNQELKIIKSDEDWWNASPEILISLDTDLAVRETGIPEGELSVALVIRDRILNSFKLVDKWNAFSVPHNSISLVNPLTSFSHSRLLDICTYLFPLDTKIRGEGIASNAGQVLGQKIFKVRMHDERTKFPKRWATPEEFEAIGLPRDTVFWIEWLAHDLNKHPSDTFVVWLNSQFKDKITSFQIGGKSGTLLERHLAASILTELATAVFNAEDQEPNELSGTISIVTDELEKTTNKSFNEMRQLFTDGHEGYSRVRAWVHEKIGVNAALDRLDFLRKQK